MHSCLLKETFRKRGICAQRPVRSWTGLVCLIITGSSWDWCQLKVVETISWSSNHNRIAIARAFKLHLESLIIRKLSRLKLWISSQEANFFTDFTELDEQIKLHYLTCSVERIAMLSGRCGCGGGGGGDRVDVRHDKVFWELLHSLDSSNLLLKKRQLHNVEILKRGADL